MTKDEHFLLVLLQVSPQGAKYYLCGEGGVTHTNSPSNVGGSQITGENLGEGEFANLESNLQSCRCEVTMLRPPARSTMSTRVLPLWKQQDLTLASFSTCKLLSNTIIWAFGSGNFFPRQVSSLPSALIVHGKQCFDIFLSSPPFQPAWWFSLLISLLATAKWSGEPPFHPLFLHLTPFSLSVSGQLQSPLTLETEENTRARHRLHLCRLKWSRHVNEVKK